jgi:hypothetical protein
MANQITLDTKNGFVPTSLLASGKAGLHKKQGSHSSALLKGTGLVAGLKVTVLELNPKPKSHQWTGKTSNPSTDYTQCTVDDLKQEAPDHGSQERFLDDNTTVSVTATDGVTTSNTITPTVLTNT